MNAQSKRMRECLAMLFASYEAPLSAMTEEEARLKLEGYLLVVRGKSVEQVEKAVADFLSGKAERPPYRRSKLPTAEEFAHQMRAPVPEGSYAEPYSAPWCVKLYSLLAAGPDPDMRAPTGFTAKMIQEGGEAGAFYRRQHQANNGFRLAKAMLDDAGQGRGRTAVVSPDLLMRVEPVAVDDPLLAQWQAEHERRGWTWLGDLWGVRVVHLPTGGPGALDDFCLKLKQCHSTGAA